MTFGSVFTGAGGIDIGLEMAGMECAWQIEINTQCRALLDQYWPKVKKYSDIRHSIPGYADVIAGGDPCPKHSRARSNGDSKSADLSGYFLALVGRLRPWWVVRENVPAPTVEHFATCLEYLGYGTVVIRIDAATITGQSRQRDFIVGNRKETTGSMRKLFSDCSYGEGSYTTRLQAREIIPALTTNRTRYDSRDCYVWHPREGLRILDSEEREAFAGFPPGWTEGFSPATRARMMGNAAVPDKTYYIGRRILEAADRHLERTA